MAVAIEIAQVAVVPLPASPTPARSVTSVKPSPPSLWKSVFAAVIQHIEIQPAIVVVISPDRAAGVDINQRDLRRQWRDRKRAIAFVAVENTGIAIASDIEIEQPSRS